MALSDRQKEIVRHCGIFLTEHGPTLMAMSSYLNLQKMANLTLYEEMRLEAKKQLHEILKRGMIEKELRKPFFKKLFEMKARGYC